MKTALLLFTLGSVAYADSIRDVDFENFTYPFIHTEFVSVPNHLRWMPRTQSQLVTFGDGRHTFPCGHPPCELLTVDHVEFGDLNGTEQTSAIVTTTFHTGGTAHWQYLYVIALRSGRPRVIAWLESGSRADMGLRGASVDHGYLVLTVNDPEKREGDCCSTGTITYRYRWQNASFCRIGAPVRKDDSQR